MWLILQVFGPKVIIRHHITQFSVPVDGVGKKMFQRLSQCFLLSNVKQFIPAGGAGGKKEHFKIMW